MVKVWVLTVVFFSVSDNGNGISTEQYEYQTQQTCQKWQKFWRKQWKVGNAVCAQVERVK